MHCNMLMGVKARLYIIVTKVGGRMPGPARTVSQLQGGCSDR